MPKRILSSLSWKAGVAAAAFALAAGTGATTVHLVNASDSEDAPAITVDDETNPQVTGDDNGEDANDDAADDESDDVADADVTPAEAPEHPDNFGAIVSEDAHDGGVDGQEIRNMNPGAEHRADAADEHTAGPNAHAEDADDEGDESDDVADDDEADEADDDESDDVADDEADDSTDDSAETED